MQPPRSGRQRGRQAANTGRFAGVSGDDNQYLVLGLPATIFDDSDTAAFIDEEHHLVPIGVDKADRYDVRHLLDSPALRALEEPVTPSAVALDEDLQLHAELELERWRDLHELQAQQATDQLADRSGEHEESDGAWHSSSGEGTISDGSEENGGPSSQSGGGQGRSRSRSPLPSYVASGNAYGAVGFSYNYPPAQDQQEEEEEEDAQSPQAPQEAPGHLYPYVPRFDVPQHLQGCLPSTERLHRVLVETARFVRRSGGQVEVLLRVKQGSNPTFSFLFPRDRSHLYYRWIVETDPKELTPPLAEVAAAAATRQAPDMQESDQQQGLAQLLIHYDQESQQEEVAGPDVKQEGKGGAQGMSKSEVKVEVKQEPEEEAGGRVGVIPDLSPARILSVKEEAGAQDTGPASQPAAWPAVTAAATARRLASPAVPKEPCAPGVAQEPAQQEDVAPASSGAQDDTQAVKAVMDKLVAFVKRSGARFEATVRQREARNPRFAFLLPWNKHHAMYRVALADALGSVAAADQLLAESAAIVAAVKQPVIVAATPAAKPAALPAQPQPHPTSATTGAVIKLQPAAVKLAPSTASISDKFSTLPTSAIQQAAPVTAAPEVKPQTAVVSESAVIAAAAQAAVAAAQAVLGPARQPLVLKANPIIPGPGVMAAAQMTGTTAAAGSIEHEAGAREVSPSPASGIESMTSAPALGMPQTGTVSSRQDALEQQQAQQQAQAMADLKQKLAERRARARALLAQKMAEKAKEEARQRVQAIQHHRNILLRGEEDNSMTLAQSALEGVPDTSHLVAAPILHKRPVCSHTPPPDAATATSLQAKPATDDDWFMALEQQEAFAPSAGAATVSTHRAALAPDGSPEPVLQPCTVILVPSQATAECHHTMANKADLHHGGSLREQTSRSSSSSSSEDSGSEEGEVVEHKHRSREHRRDATHRHRSRDGHCNRHQKHSGHSNRSRSNSRSRRRSHSREHRKSSRRRRSRKDIKHESSSKGKKNPHKRSRPHSKSPPPAKAVRAEQGPGYASAPRDGSANSRQTTSSETAAGSGIAVDAGQGPSDLRARLRAMLGKVL